MPSSGFGPLPASSLSKDSIEKQYSQNIVRQEKRSSVRTPHSIVAKRNERKLEISWLRPREMRIRESKALRLLIKKALLALNLVKLRFRYFLKRVERVRFLFSVEIFL